MRPLRSPVALPSTWPGAVLAALRSGRVPRVLSATTLDLVTQQEGPRSRWPLYEGRSVHLGEDPAVALVRLDPVFGWRDGARSSGRSRSSSPTPPVAATVTADTRLVVGPAEHLVQCAGARSPAGHRRFLIVASPEGGEVTLLGGREVGAISSRGLGEALSRFDPLDPWGGWFPLLEGPLYEREGRPLYGLVIG